MYPLWSPKNSEELRSRKPCLLNEFFIKALVEMKFF